MIHSLTFPVAATARPTIPAVTTPTEPAPPVVTPQDGADLSHIDNAVTVATTPILDPAVVGALVVGSLIGAQSQVAVMVHTHLLTGTTPDPVPSGAVRDPRFECALDFAIDPTNAAQPIYESGMLGGRFDTGSLSVDPDTHRVHFDSLYLSKDDATQAVHVDGSLGPVATHLIATLSDDPSLPPGTLAVHTEGTLGDKPYTLDTRFALGDDGRGSITARGALDGAPITKDYAFNIDPDGRMALSGGGVVAGVPTHLDASLEMAAAK